MKKLLLCLLCLCLFACSPSDNPSNGDIDSNDPSTNQDVVDNNEDLKEYPDCYDFVQDFLNFFNTNYPEYEVKLIENTYSAYIQEAHNENDEDRLYVSIEAINKFGNKMDITFEDWGLQGKLYFGGISFTHESLITPEEKEFIIALTHALGLNIDNQDFLIELKEGLNKMSNDEYEDTTMAYLEFKADKIYFIAQRIEGNDGTNRYGLFIYK